MERHAAVRRRASLDFLPSHPTSNQLSPVKRELQRRPSLVNPHMLECPGFPQMMFSTPSARVTQGVATVSAARARDFEEAADFETVVPFGAFTSASSKPIKPLPQPPLSPMKSPQRQAVLRRNSSLSESSNIHSRNHPAPSGSNVKKYRQLAAEGAAGSAQHHGRTKSTSINTRKCDGVEDRHRKQHAKNKKTQDVEKQPDNLPPIQATATTMTVRRRSQRRGSADHVRGSSSVLHSNSVGRSRSTQLRSSHEYTTATTNTTSSGSSGSSHHRNLNRPTQQQQHRQQNLQSLEFVFEDDYIEDFAGEHVDPNNAFDPCKPQNPFRSSARSSNIRSHPAEAAAATTLNTRSGTGGVGLGTAATPAADTGGASRAARRRASAGPGASLFVNSTSANNNNNNNKMVPCSQDPAAANTHPRKVVRRSNSLQPTSRVERNSMRRPGASKTRSLSPDPLQQHQPPHSPTLQRTGLEDRTSSQPKNLTPQRKNSLSPRKVRPGNQSRMQQPPSTPRQTKESCSNCKTLSSSPSRDKTTLREEHGHHHRHHNNKNSSPSNGKKSRPQDNVATADASSSSPNAGHKMKGGPNDTRSPPHRSRSSHHEELISNGRLNQDSSSPRRRSNSIGSIPVPQQLTPQSTTISSPFALSPFTGIVNEIPSSSPPSSKTTASPNKPCSRRVNGSNSMKINDSSKNIAKTPSHNKRLSRTTAATHQHSKRGANQINHPSTPTTEASTESEVTTTANGDFTLAADATNCSVVAPSSPPIVSAPMHKTHRRASASAVCASRSVESLKQRRRPSAAAALPSN